MAQTTPDTPAPAAAGPDRPHRTRQVVLAAVVVAVVLAAVVGVLVFRSTDSTADADPGVTACGAAGVALRADRGEQVDAAELKRVGELFQRSTHEDLKTAGVTAVGLAQRVATTSDPAGDGYRQSLHVAVPRLVAACDQHGVTVKV